MTYDPLKHIILRTEVGSTAYGTGLPGHEDYDNMAVCVETKEQTIGLERFEHYIHRPGRGPTDPSGPGDLDLVVYSLRKWARLALKGNPSVLMLLFGPQVEAVNPYAGMLYAMRGLFATQHAQTAFLGYMQRQRQRMQGTRGAAGRIRRNPNTPCGTCAGTGYVVTPSTATLTCPTCRGAGVAVDWKYAMHMVRLGYHGYQYCSTGLIEVPIPEPMRTVLVNIRNGSTSLADVIHMAEEWEWMLKRLTLPPEAPFARVQQTVMDIYEGYWQ